MARKKAKKPEDHRDLLAYVDGDAPCAKCGCTSKTRCLVELPPEDVEPGWVVVCLRMAGWPICSGCTPGRSRKHYALKRIEDLAK